LAGKKRTLKKATMLWTYIKHAIIVCVCCMQ